MDSRLTRMTEKSQDSRFIVLNWPEIRLRGAGRTVPESPYAELRSAIVFPFGGASLAIAIGRRAPLELATTLHANAAVARP